MPCTRKVCSHEVRRDVLISLDEGTHHEVLHDDFESFNSKEGRQGKNDSAMSPQCVTVSCAAGRTKRCEEPFAGHTKLCPRNAPASRPGAKPENPELVK